MKAVPELTNPRDENENTCSQFSYLVLPWGILQLNFNNYFCGAFRKATQTFGHKAVF